MSIVSDIFSNSSSEKDKKPKARRNSDIQAGGNSNDSELMAIMKAKNLDMTSSSIKLTTPKTSSKLSVTRSNMLRSIEDGISKVKRKEKKVFGNASNREENKLEMEVHAAEDDAKKVINSDIDHREKLVVSSAVLLEASELLADHIGDLFGLKVAIGDRKDGDIRNDMKNLWMDTNRIVEMNMPAYKCIHEHAKDEPELVPVTVKSANLFRNCVKVFSALTVDSGQELHKKQRYQKKEPDFISSNQTIYRKYFAS